MYRYYTENVSYQRSFGDSYLDNIEGSQPLSQTGIRNCLRQITFRMLNGTLVQIIGSP